MEGRRQRRWTLADTGMWVTAEQRLEVYREICRATSCDMEAKFEHLDSFVVMAQPVALRSSLQPSALSGAELPSPFRCYATARPSIDLPRPPTMHFLPCPSSRKLWMLFLTLFAVGEEHAIKCQQLTRLTETE